MRSMTIADAEAGQRFDKYLKKLLSNAPAGFLYKMLRKKNIVLNGRKADGSEKLAAGDEVKLFLAEETFIKFTAAQKDSGEFERLAHLPDVNLPVVYEDVDVIILNKPQGMLSQKAEASDVSANEYLLAYLIRTGYLTEAMMETFRPAVCNRLDRNTSGLLIAGKTLKGLQEMSAALKERTIHKYYRCIVKGEVKKSACIKGYLEKDARTNKVTVSRERKKDGSKEIETEYEPIKVQNGYSLLEVHLITGRSHQIRAHLALAGRPIIGDAKYGDKKENRMFFDGIRLTNQLLHAYRLEFADGRVVTAPPDPMFEKAWKYIEEK